MKTALELIDGALADPDGDYRALVATIDDEVAGYICYGPSPMTVGTWDLYWIVTDADRRGAGVGSSLVAAMEDELRTLGGKRVRVETSHTDGYGAAHRFYVRTGYPEVARLRDFYDVGDDLIVMMKVL